jgi:two-component system response regulator YesN
VYKLYLVDDEPSIRSGLKQIIPWEEYGIEVAGEASNGVEAFQFISKHRPDIVICDIRMPVMSGLELIRQAYESGIGSRFIILSGYDDFHYVKEALKYNVENYLLKPIQVDEMEQTIHQIVGKLESDLLMQLERSRENELILNNVLNRAITNQIDLYVLKNKLQLIPAGIDLFDSKLQAAVIDFLTKGAGPAANSSAAIQAILDICLQTFPADYAVVFLDHAGRIVIICRVEDAGRQKERLVQYLQRVYDRSPDLEDARWVMTAGSLVNGCKHLHESYQNALSVQQYRIYCEERDVIFYEDVAAKQAGYSNWFTVDHLHLEESLMNGDVQGVRQFVEQTFQRLSRLGADPDAVYSFVMEVVISLLRVIRIKGIPQSEIFSDESRLLRYIYGFEDIGQLKRWLNAKIEATVDGIKNPKTENMSKVVKDLLLYIDQHYHEDLSLKTYSQKIHYNPIYLGRLFRKETGEVFSDYVNKVRIEKSKSLLRSSSMKINDISEAIGFSNPNYYHNIFKKLVGMTPSEYRNNIRLPGSGTPRP